MLQFNFIRKWPHFFGEAGSNSFANITKKLSIVGCEKIKKSCEKLLRKKIVLDGVGVFFGVANYNYLFARHLKCLDKITFEKGRQKVFKMIDKKSFKSPTFPPCFITTECVIWMENLLHYLPLDENSSIEWTFRIKLWLQI